MEALLFGTHTLRLLLAALLCVLLLGRGRALAAAARHGWLLLAVFYLVLALDNILIEVLRRTLGPGHAGYLRFYSQVYLLNSVLSYALPAALLAVLAATPRLRMVSGVAALALGAGGAMVAVGQPPESWEALFNVTRVLSLLGIAGYLAFVGLLVLGRLPAAGRHLGAVVAIRAAFVLLVPVNEAFFDWLERGRAAGAVAAETTLADYWLLLQILQFVATAAQVAVVAHFLVRVRPHPVEEHLRTHAPA
jgi:hypothetical protein